MTLADTNDKAGQGPIISRAAHSLERWHGGVRVLLRVPHVVRQDVATHGVGENDQRLRPRSQSVDVEPVDRLADPAVNVQVGRWSWLQWLLLVLGMLALIAVGKRRLSR